MTHEHTFAARNGKTELYKFRPYTSDEERRRVHEILIEHKVYFARRSQLNDPFDLSPKLDIVDRETLIAAAKAYWQNRPELPQAERDRFIEYLSTCDLAQHQAEAHARIVKRLEDEYWVFSLAGNRKESLLWSYYAGGHTGVAIHFRADGEAIFGASIAVTYSDERPVLPIDLRSISESETFRRVCLRKAAKWAHEEEYRWIRYPNTDWTGVAIRFEGQHAHFRASQLCGITLGARMPDALAAQLIELADGHVPQLPVWRARESHGFEMDFERIA